MMTVFYRRILSSTGTALVTLLALPALAQVRTAPPPPPPPAQRQAPPPPAQQPPARPDAARPADGQVRSGGHPQTRDPKQVEQARVKLLQRIRAMRAQELALVLNPDTAAVNKVVELSSGFEDRLLAARQDLRSQRAELDRLLADAKADDSAITRATDELLARRRKLDDIEAERTAALRKVLTPAQFARLVVAWPRINRKIHAELYRALLSSKAGKGGADEE